jgi:hypothetical protein
MPHRVLRVALLDQICRCCSAEDAERVVDALIAMGVRLPTVTITDVRELDQIPDGSAVIVGNLQDPTALPAVGTKRQYSIMFSGEEQPYPFHEPGLAPPLPCVVVWMPGDQIEQLRGVV